MRWGEATSADAEHAANNANVSTMGLGGSSVGRALDFHARSPGLEPQHHTDRVWRCVLVISAFWEVRGKERGSKSSLFTQFKANLSINKQIELDNPCGWYLTVSSRSLIGFSRTMACTSCLLGQACWVYGRGYLQDRRIRKTGKLPGSYLPSKHDAEGMDQ